MEEFHVGDAATYSMLLVDVGDGVSALAFLNFEFAFISVRASFGGMSHHIDEDV